VLLDQSGNSLERSMLLAHLLQDAGYEARLVRGSLSKTAVDAVFSGAAKTKKESLPDQPGFPEEFISAAQEAPGQAKDLASFVGDLPDNWVPARQATVDHWWVEARPANEWVTVDLLLNGPLADMRPEPQEHFSTDSVPESLFHKVTIRIVIEQWDNGRIKEAIPLEHTLQAPEAVYHDLELLFSPFHFEPQPEDSDAAQGARAVAETSEEWLPVLRIGEENIQKQGFDREGNLEVNPGRIAAARKAEAATSALQTLGGTEDEPPKTHLSALWIEYQVDVPGREPRIVRRELFDLIGPARRRSGAIEDLAVDSTANRERGRSLMGSHRILITSAALPRVALEKAALEFWAEQGPQIAALIRLVHNPEDDEAAGRAYRQPLKALDLLGFATARHALSPHRSSIYLASPNILSTHLIAELDESYQVRRAFDIVINDVGVVPNSTVSASRIRLEQGVLDTILEAAMMGTEARSGNTADLFASRGESSGDWRRVSKSTEISALSETARARIADALAAGRIVVAPERLGTDHEPAWWEIDPVTGTTLGIGHKGWGVVAEQTVRGIATGGVMHGARRYSIMTFCRAAVAALYAGGWIFVNMAGAVVYTWQAVDFLISRGCSIVI
jgi:hypothetical protein